VPAARRLGIGIVCYSPLGRGLLTSTLTQAAIAGSDFRRGDPRFNGADLDRNLSQVEAMRRLAAELEITPGQLALAWLLAQGSDVIPIPGSRHADRIAENAGAAAVRLGPADLRRLEEAVPRAAWSGDRTSFAAAVTTREPG
jgi:aryl-alcohol dehydrogenase-like predicted oxidoreductase